MTAPPSQLDELSRKLWRHGIAGFCPTTLSAPRRELAESVQRMGRWIRSCQARSSRSHDNARPLGIHLEGPFLSPHACGAHPRGSIRPFDETELAELWELSLGTLRIVTFAPERLSVERLRRLVAWAKPRGVRLSLGHSRATQTEAQAAFDAGVSGVTHAWNALAFHQRAPGALGAAMGRKDVRIELIADQIHVSQTVMNWTRKLHPASATCLVSDCAPAAGWPAPSRYTKFGALRVRHADGACRLSDGSLAGGGKLLSQGVADWLFTLAKTPAQARQQLRSLSAMASVTPLRAIGESTGWLSSRKIRWRWVQGRWAAEPASSRS